MSRSTYKTNMQLLFLTSLVVAGYISFDLLAFSFEMSRSDLHGARALVAFVAVAPCVPLASALIVRFTTIRIAGWLAGTLAVIAGGCGVLLSLLGAALSYTGSLLVIVHGITLTAAVAGAFLLLSRSRVGHRSALVLFIAPVLGAVWSLVAFGLVTFSAYPISEGRPYCLATPPVVGPVLSLSDLRAFAFYTTTEQAFHGLLLVQDGPETIVYNWSPRRMRFDPVLQPELLSPDPRLQCSPLPNFLSGIPLISIVKS